MKKIISILSIVVVILFALTCYKYFSKHTSSNYVKKPTVRKILAARPSTPSQELKNDIKPFLISKKDFVSICKKESVLKFDKENIQIKHRPQNIERYCSCNLKVLEVSNLPPFNFVKYFDSIPMRHLKQQLYYLTGHKKAIEIKDTCYG